MLKFRLPRWQSCMTILSIIIVIIIIIIIITIIIIIIIIIVFVVVMDTQKNFSECFRCSFEGSYAKGNQNHRRFSDNLSLSPCSKHNQTV